MGCRPHPLIGVEMQRGPALPGRGESQPTAGLLDRSLKAVAAAAGPLPPPPPHLLS